MEQETMSRLRAEIRAVLDDAEQVEVVERSAVGLDAEEIAMEMRTTVERVYCLRARARVRMRRNRRNHA